MSEEAAIRNAPPRQGARPSAWGLLLLLVPCLAYGQGLPKAKPSDVEAAFLRNFAHYVTWPANAFADDHSPWQICILGSSTFGDALEKTLSGRAEQGRSFEIHRADTMDELPRCQIVVVAHPASEQRREALDRLKNQPVLTVGDAPGFLQEGGIIRFEVSDHVDFSVNLGQARAASLKIPTKMLEIAREVLDNGNVRRRG